MAESTAPKVTGLIPMARAANVQRSVDFYKHLGMEIRGSLRTPSGDLQWVHLSCDQADLMFARASDPVIAGQQAVLFYLYSPDLNSPDLIALRAHLLAEGVRFRRLPIPTTCPRARFAWKIPMAPGRLSRCDF